MSILITLECDEYSFHAWDLKDISMIDKPGVYVLSDIKGGIIYVGKANNVGSRVVKHIRAQTKELARNRLNYITKHEYLYIYAVGMYILDNPLECTWFEAYKINCNNPVFNYDMRTDLIGNTARKRKKYYENMKQTYLDKNYGFNRDAEDSYWTSFEREIMKFVTKRKPNQEYGLTIEDIVFNKIYNSIFGDFTLDKYAMSLTSANSARDIVIKEIVKATGLSESQVIDRARRIAKQKSFKSMDISGFINAKIS